MPNQEWRHHTACAINFRHGNGEEAAFAKLFCGLIGPDVLWGGSCICNTFLRNASARCALCRDESFPNLPTHPYTVHSHDLAVLNLAESECV